MLYWKYNQQERYWVAEQEYQSTWFPVEYTIHVEENGFFCAHDNSSNIVGEYTTLAEAKQACQNHYQN